MMNEASQKKNGKIGCLERSEFLYSCKGSDALREIHKDIWLTFAYFRKGRGIEEDWLNFYRTKEVRIDVGFRYAC